MKIFAALFSVKSNLDSGQEYVMGALSKKTVLLVTHQVDFLPAFDSILVSEKCLKFILFLE